MVEVTNRHRFFEDLAYKGQLHPTIKVIGRRLSDETWIVQHAQLEAFIVVDIPVLSGQSFLRIRGPNSVSVNRLLLTSTLNKIVEYQGDVDSDECVPGILEICHLDLYIRNLM
jgi:hypothetical protein